MSGSYKDSSCALKHFIPVTDVVKHKAFYVKIKVCQTSEAKYNLNVGKSDIARDDTESYI